MKHLAILSAILFLVACEFNHSSTPERILTRPSDIPAVTCSGDSIEWTWSDQAAYDEGRYFVFRDESGCVEYTAIKHPTGTIDRLEKQGALKQVK